MGVSSSSSSSVMHNLTCPSTTAIVTTNQRQKPLPPLPLEVGDQRTHHRLSQKQNSVSHSVINQDDSQKKRASSAPDIVFPAEEMFLKPVALYYSDLHLAEGSEIGDGWKEDYSLILKPMLYKYPQTPASNAFRPSVNLLPEATSNTKQETRLRIEPRTSSLGQKQMSNDQKLLSSTTPFANKNIVDESASETEWEDSESEGISAPSSADRAYFPSSELPKRQDLVTVELEEAPRRNLTPSSNSRALRIMGVTENELIKMTTNEARSPSVKSSCSLSSELSPRHRRVMRNAPCSLDVPLCDEGSRSSDGYDGDMGDYHGYEEKYHDTLQETLPERLPSRIDQCKEFGIAPLLPCGPDTATTNRFDVLGRAKTKKSSRKAQVVSRKPSMIWLDDSSSETESRSRRLINFNSASFSSRLSHLRGRPSESKAETSEGPDHVRTTSARLLRFFQPKNGSREKGTKYRHSIASISPTGINHRPIEKSQISEPFPIGVSPPDRFKQDQTGHFNGTVRPVSSLMALNEEAFCRPSLGPRAPRPVVVSSSSKSPLQTACLDGTMSNLARSKPRQAPSLSASHMRGPQTIKQENNSPASPLRPVSALTGESTTRSSTPNTNSVTAGNCSSSNTKSGLLVDAENKKQQKKQKKGVSFVLDDRTVSEVGSGADYIRTKASTRHTDTAAALSPKRAIVGKYNDKCCTCHCYSSNSEFSEDADEDEDEYTGTEDEVFCG